MDILDNNCLKTHTCLVVHTKLSPIYISYENTNSLPWRYDLFSPFSLNDLSFWSLFNFTNIHLCLSSKLGNKELNVRRSKRIAQRWMFKSKSSQSWKMTWITNSSSLLQETCKTKGRLTKTSVIQLLFIIQARKRFLYIDVFYTFLLLLKSS